MPITNPAIGSTDWGGPVNDTITRVNALEGIETTIAAKQPLDSDLTAIAALTATTDNFIQSKSSAWASRTPTQVAADLVTPLSSSLQPLDSDLTAIAALAPTNDDVVQRKAGAWTNRTLAQLKTDLSLQPLDSDLTTIAGLTATTDCFMQSKSSAWSVRTPAQVATDLVAQAAFTSAYQPVDSDLTAIAALTATTDNFMQSKSSAWSSRTPAQVATDLAAQTAFTAAFAPVASPTFTGTVTTPRLITPPVALTDAATIVVDAALGNHYRVTLGGNRTLGAPSNPTNGQKILFEIIQDGTGTRTLAYNAAYAFGTDVPSPTLTTTINKRDFIGFVYNSTATLWYCLAVAKGY